MEFKHSALVLASLFFFTFLQSTQPSYATTKNLVADFCNESQHPRFCMKIFGSDPLALKAKNYNDLAAVVLITCSDKVKGYANYVKRMMKTNHAKALSVCADNFNVSSGTLRSSLTSMKEDPLSATYEAKVASDGAAICRAAMAEAKLRIPIITTKTTKIQMYSDLGFTITNIIERESMV